VGALRLLSGYPADRGQRTAQGQDDAGSLGSSVGSNRLSRDTCFAGLLHE